MSAPEAIFTQCSPPRRYLSSDRPRGGIYAVLAPEAVFKIGIYVFVLYIYFIFPFCKLDFAMGFTGYIYRTYNGFISVRIY